MAYNYRIEAWFTEESFPRQCVPKLHVFAKKHDVKLKFQSKRIQPELGPYYDAAIIKLAARTKEVAAIAWDHFKQHHFPKASAKLETGVYHTISNVQLFIGTRY